MRVDNNCGAADFTEVNTGANNGSEQVQIMSKLWNGSTVSGPICADKAQADRYIAELRAIDKRHNFKIDYWTVQVD